MKKTLIFACLFLSSLLYGQGNGYNASRILTTSVTGPDITLPEQSLIGWHQISWIVTGSPSSCTVKLEQSPDNVTWSDLIINQTCTSNGMSAISSQTLNAYVRLNVTALGGGTSPSITATYEGWAYSPNGTGGTATSVGLSVQSGSSSGMFSVTGSPVTTSGTLNINLTGTTGYIGYFTNTNIFGTSSTFTYIPPTLSITPTQTSGTAAVLNVAPTWNSSGSVFDAALLVNPTDTASATGSLLADFQDSGTSKAKIDKAGNITATSINLVNGAYTAQATADSIGRFSVGALYTATYTYNVGEYYDAAASAGSSGCPLTSNVTTTLWNCAPTLTAPTVNTQTAGDNSTKAASTAYVNTVYNLVQTSGSPYTLLGKTGYYWNDASGAYTFQLDAPVAGKQYCFGNYSGQTGAITVKSTTSVYIVYKGSNGTVTTGTLVSGGAAGDFVCMEGVDSTHYMVAGAGYGTWTNN